MTRLKTTLITIALGIMFVDAVVAIKLRQVWPLGYVTGDGRTWTFVKVSFTPVDVLIAGSVVLAQILVIAWAVYRLKKTERSRGPGKGGKGDIHDI